MKQILKVKVVSTNPRCIYHRLCAGGKFLYFFCFSLSFCLVVFGELVLWKPGFCWKRTGEEVLNAHTLNIWLPLCSHSSDGRLHQRSRLTSAQLTFIPMNHAFVTTLQLGYGGNKMWSVTVNSLACARLEQSATLIPEATIMSYKASLSGEEIVCSVGDVTLRDQNQITSPCQQIKAHAMLLYASNEAAILTVKVPR